MSGYISPIGSRWEDVREEFMSVFTPEERAQMDANVKALGELLDALDAGIMTQEEFDAAFDDLNQPVEARRPAF